MKIKNIIRGCLAYPLFWLGDLISRILNVRFISSLTPFFISYAGYRVYNWFMITSDKIQGVQDDFGPWKTPKEQKYDHD